jgi:hypothetical protein
MCLSDKGIAFLLFLLLVDTLWSWEYMTLRIHGWASFGQLENAWQCQVRWFA